MPSGRIAPGFLPTPRPLVPLSPGLVRRSLKTSIPSCSSSYFLAIFCPSLDRLAQSCLLTWSASFFTPGAAGASWAARSDRTLTPATRARLIPRTSADFFVVIAGLQKVTGWPPLAGRRGAEKRITGRTLPRPSRSGEGSRPSFPSSAWEREAPKLCFVATTHKQNVTHLSSALPRSRASRRCVPKQNLGTRACSPSPKRGGERYRKDNQSSFRKSLWHLV